MRPLPSGMPSSQHEEIPSNVSFMVIYPPYIRTAAARLIIGVSLESST